MEIVYFLQNKPGGVTTFVYNLLKYRPQSDTKYKLIIYRHKQDKSATISLNFNVDEQIYFEYDYRDNLYYVFRKLKKHISTESIIVANDLLEIRFVEALKLPNKLIYILHGDFKYYYKIAETYQNVIDFYFTVSLYIKEQLTQKLKQQEKSRIKTEYAPIPKIEFVNKYRNQKGINISFVGSIDKRKGTQFFYEIIKELLNKNVKFNFDIIGDGPLFSKIRNELSVFDNVFFRGQISNEEVIGILKETDVFLFPTLSEGMPLSVIEAMKAGCVPVVSDIPTGIPEIIINGKTGYRIEIGGTKEFAKKILILYKNKELLNKMKASCVFRANKMFDPYIQAAKYEEAILNSKCIHKKFIVNNMGRILNKEYLPNFFVKFVRTIIKHPKV